MERAAGRVVMRVDRHGVDRGTCRRRCAQDNMEDHKADDQVAASPRHNWTFTKNGPQCSEMKHQCLPTCAHGCYKTVRAMSLCTVTLPAVILLSDACDTSSSGTGPVALGELPEPEAPYPPAPACGFTPIRRGRQERHDAADSWRLIRQYLPDADALSVRPPLGSSTQNPAAGSPCRKQVLIEARIPGDQG